jgi:hypothetical protein
MGVEFRSISMLHIEIHVKGQPDPNLADWFQGMQVQPISPEEFCLTSLAEDNSAVYGIISSLSSLGLTLISVSVTDQIKNNGAIHLDGGESAHR